jgi:hypothetical protein
MDILFWVVVALGFLAFGWYITQVYRLRNEEVLYLRLRVCALEDTVRFMKTNNSKYGEHWWFLEEGSALKETVEGKARWQRVEDVSTLIEMAKGIEREVRERDDS